MLPPACRCAPPAPTHLLMARTTLPTPLGRWHVSAALQAAVGNGWPACERKPISLAPAASLLSLRPECWCSRLARMSPLCLPAAQPMPMPLRFASACSPTAGAPPPHSLFSQPFTKSGSALAQTPQPKCPSGEHCQEAGQSGLHGLLGHKAAAAGRASPSGGSCSGLENPPTNIHTGCLCLAALGWWSAYRLMGEGVACAVGALALLVSNAPFSAHTCAPPHVPLCPPMTEIAAVSFACYQLQLQYYAGSRRQGHQADQCSR